MNSKELVPKSCVPSAAGVKCPALVNISLSAAAALEPVLKCKDVALLLEEKSPSDIAAISAATSIASVPVPSSGAWKAILPNTSSAAMSVSPVCSVSAIGLSSAVAVCFNVNPTL